VTGIIGSAAWAVFVSLRPTWKEHRRQVMWRKANLALLKHQSIVGSLELVQSGWRKGAFSESNVLITVEDQFRLNPDIKANIYEESLVKWSRQNQENNVQIGVSSLDSYRKLNSAPIDEGSSNHLLHIVSHSFKYYDFLASNQSYVNGSEHAKDLLEEKVSDRHALHPISAFANPLSVGLSILCEGGDTLVLAKRSKKISTGGSYSPNLIYNPVGEMMNPKDEIGVQDGHVMVSPWRTATRALGEEVGWALEDIRNVDITLHSFAWDKRILDYKFFGCVVTSLAWADVWRKWETALDRHESRELFNVPIASRDQCRQVLKRISDERDAWGVEAVFCTIQSLLYLEKLRTSDLDDIFK